MERRPMETMGSVFIYNVQRQVHMVSSGRMQHQTAFSLFVYPKRRKERQEMSASNIKQQHTPVIRQFRGKAVVYIPLSGLHPFSNQSFKVREDSAMQETVESVWAKGAKLGHLFNGKKSVKIIAEQAEESKTQIQRYIRLTELSPSLQQKVDEGILALTTAVELPYLIPDE